MTHFRLLLVTHSGIFLAVTKKIRLLLLLRVISAILGDCWGTHHAQLHLLPDFLGGWGKVNQHNAESCCLYFACQTANKHKWFFNDRPLYPAKLSTHKHSNTHTHRTFAPTHIHNEFYQGKYIWFNGSLQMPFPLKLLYLSSNKMLFFPPLSLIFSEP